MIKKLQSNKFDLPALLECNSTKGSLPKPERLSTHCPTKREKMAADYGWEYLIHSGMRFAALEHFRRIYSLQPIICPWQFYWVRSENWFCSLFYSDSHSLIWTTQICGGSGGGFHNITNAFVERPYHTLLCPMLAQPSTAQHRVLK